MTYRAEDREEAEGSVTLADPALGSAEFEPLEGERLEHLASRRRGPLRWAAGLVLAVQAGRQPSEDRGDEAFSPEENDDWAPGAWAGEFRRRPRTPAQLRRSVLRRGGRPGLRPVEGTTDLTSELQALVCDELAAASPTPCAPAAVSGPFPVTAEPESAEAPGARPVAPISGWVGTAEDEEAWQQWASDPAASDRDGQLADLGAALSRRLPGPLRLAERLGRRRQADPLPIDD